MKKTKNIAILLMVLLVMDLFQPVIVLFDKRFGFYEARAYTSLPPEYIGDVNYLYDGTGQRLTRLVNGRDHTYYIGNVEITFKADGTTSWKKDYGVAVREKDAGGERLYYSYKDHLGNVSQSYDRWGRVISQQAYYPYGMTRVKEGSMPTDREYTNQVSDMDEAGLYYYNARYYNPRLALFTQADKGNDGQNKYAYVGGNPINRTDPTGNAYEAGTGGSGGRSPLRSLQLGNGYNWSISATEPIRPLDLTKEEFNFYGGLFLGGVGGGSLIITLSPEALTLYTACLANPTCAKTVATTAATLTVAGDALDVASCLGGNLESCGYVISPGPGMGLADDFGEFVGSGRLGRTYVNRNTGVLTKIFNDPLDPENIAQLEFMKKYGGGIEGIPKYFGEVKGGYQMEYIEGLNLGDFVNSGGTLSLDEVKGALVRLEKIHEFTGMAHNDLVTTNIIVRNLPTGGHDIVFIDFYAKNRSILPLDDMEYEKMNFLFKLKGALGK